MKTQDTVLEEAGAIWAFTKEDFEKKCPEGMKREDYSSISSGGMQITGLLIPTANIKKMEEELEKIN